MYRILFISASGFRHFFVHCFACTSDEQHHFVLSDLAMSPQWYVRTWLNRLFLSIYLSKHTVSLRTTNWRMKSDVDETLHANLRSHRCVVFDRSSGFCVKLVVCTYARKWRKRHVQFEYCKRMIDVEDEFIYTVWIHFIAIFCIIFSLFFYYRWISSTSAVIQFVLSWLRYAAAAAMAATAVLLLHEQFNLIVSVYY